MGLQQARMHNVRGFTLLELMVVLAILGALTAVAVPSFQEWRERAAVNNATNALFSKLKQARSLAVAESRSVKVSFNTAAPYGFVYDDVTGCAYCKHDAIAFSEFSPNVIFKSNVASTTFTRKGTANSLTTKIEMNGYFKCVRINLLGRAFILGDFATASAGAKTTCRNL